MRPLARLQGRQRVAACAELRQFILEADFLTLTDADAPLLFSRMVAIILPTPHRPSAWQPGGGHLCPLRDLRFIETQAIIGNSVIWKVGRAVDCTGLDLIRALPWKHGRCKESNSANPLVIFTEATPSEA